MQDEPAIQPEPRSFSSSQEDTAPTAELSVLKKDHEQVRRLGEEYRQASDLLEKVTLAERISLALTLHAQLEEEIFYPALRQAGAAPEMIDEAVVEHMTLRQLVTDVESASAEDALLDAKVRVLLEYVEHHVKEEEAELFAFAAAHLDVAMLDARLTARRASLAYDAAIQLKSRLRSSGPAAKMSMEHPTASVQAMPGPIRAAAAAADLALAVLPGGGRIRRILRPERRDDTSVSPGRPSF
ncbi:hemerythrin domain-containing protein [Phenylobacterium sp.]|jgi:hemerythrin superfamily protein|uniref:hemerythrin domain-containing protein n=1 Tax=Phenylobacterium sp. TaxID=1871053 RepID=UPI002F95BB63